MVYIWKIQYRTHAQIERQSEAAEEIQSHWHPDQVNLQGDRLCLRTSDGGYIIVAWQDIARVDVVEGEEGAD
jgi:hypothetical protein